jgi:hypothetical protein
LDQNSKWFILATKEGEKILTASYSKRLFDAKDEESLMAELKKMK